MTIPLVQRVGIMSQGFIRTLAGYYVCHSQIPSMPPQSTAFRHFLLYSSIHIWNQIIWWRNTEEWVTALTIVSKSLFFAIPNSLCPFSAIRKSLGQEEISQRKYMHICKTHGHRHKCREQLVERGLGGRRTRGEMGNTCNSVNNNFSIKNL